MSTRPIQTVERFERLEAAYADAISALRYIRLRYGDLYGVGWARLDETHAAICDTDSEMSDKTGQERAKPSHKPMRTEENK